MSKRTKSPLVPFLQHQWKALIKVRCLLHVRFILWNICSFIISFNLEKSFQSYSVDPTRSSFCYLNNVGHMPNRSREESLLICILHLPLLHTPCTGKRENHIQPGWKSRDIRSSWLFQNMSYDFIRPSCQKLERADGLILEEISTRVWEF